MTLLRVEDLRTWFRTDSGSVRAVDGVDLTLDRERTLAIVGESGSGKSVLVRTIMGLQWARNIERVEGHVWLDDVDLQSLKQGELRELWGRRVSMVFQNPMTSLNPVMPIGRQVGEVLTIRLGMSRAEAKTRTLELLADVGIADPARRATEYPHQLSGGMRQRVTIAIALAGEPDLLIADEPTTALDVTVQAQILALLAKLQREHGMALILVTHDLGVAMKIADEIVVMYAGKVVERAPARTLGISMRMRYTQALLNARPKVDGASHSRLAVIPGRPPSMLNPIGGCAFAPRCGYAQERCAIEEPPLESAGDRHQFACWYPNDAALSSTTRNDGEESPTQ